MITGAHGIALLAERTKTALIGRDEAITTVLEALSRSRLVTLVGEGGRGKTRLALNVGQAARARYRDGVWPVEFAGDRNDASLAEQLADALDVRELPGLPIETSLAAGIGERRMLIVLDNCERVRAEAARLAEDLLRACPGVTVLATSRVPLGADGETLYPVEGLATPAADAAANPTSLDRWDSVRLFVDRLAAHSDFTLTTSNSSAVAQVCRAVEGSPLALEIVAARASSTTVEQVAASLRSRQGHRASEALDDLIEWSYDQLDPVQRTVLRTCGVFVGGWDPSAIEAVLGTAHPSVDAGELTSVLRGLAAEALIVADESEGRFRLLDTVRQSVWRRAEQADEAARVRGAHARWYAEWAAGPARDLAGAGQIEAVRRIEGEYDNLRAAGAFLLRTRAVGPAQKLVADLATYREIRGLLTEGATRGLEALDLGESEFRLRAMVGTARILLLRLDPRAHGLYERILELGRRANDLRTMADAEQGLGNVVFWRREIQAAEAHYLEAYALRQESGDADGIASCLHSLGNVRLRDDRLPEAEALFEQALRIRRERGDLRGITMSLGAMGQLALSRGNDDDAVALVREVVRHLSDLRLRWALALSLTSLLKVAERRGEFRRAAVLAGARARVREITGFPVPEAELEDLYASLAALRERCGAETYDAAYAEGYAKDWNEAVSLALESP